MDAAQQAAGAPTQAAAPGKMTLLVHCTLADVPFVVQLDEPTVGDLQFQVAKHCNFPATDFLKAVRGYALLLFPFSMSLLINPNPSHGDLQERIG